MTGSRPRCPGGGGRDSIFDEPGMTAVLRGGDGNDYLYFRRYFGASWRSAAMDEAPQGLPIMDDLSV
jgi:hypothetical protein